MELMGTKRTKTPAVMRMNNPTRLMTLDTLKNRAKALSRVSKLSLLLALS